jgi:hypothetical protein
MTEQLEALRQRKKAMTETVTIAGDSEAAGLWLEAKAKVDTLEKVYNVQRNRAGGEAVAEQTLTELRDAQRRYERLTEEIRDTLLEFKFQAIGRKKYDDLINEHQMDDARRKAFLAENRLDEKDLMTNWDPESFPTALIAASMVAPLKGNTPEGIEEIIEWLNDDTWNETEVMELFRGAMTVNNTRRIVELGKD